MKRILIAVILTFLITGLALYKEPKDRIIKVPEIVQVEKVREVEGDPPEVYCDQTDGIIECETDEGEVVGSFPMPAPQAEAPTTTTIAPLVAPPGYFKVPCAEDSSPEIVMHDPANPLPPGVWYRCRHIDE